MAEKAPRRWLSFNLRTMFVVITVLACWLGWELSAVRGRQLVLREIAGNAAFQVTSVEAWQQDYPTGSPLGPPARISVTRALLGDKAIQEIWVIRHYGSFS